MEGKHLPKASKSFGDPLDANLSTEQCPKQTTLFRQKAEPSFAVGRHTQVGLAKMSVFDSELAVSNRHRGILFLFAGEREVIDRIQVLRLAWLKREGKTSQERRDGLDSETIADPFESLLGKEAATRSSASGAGEQQKSSLLFR